MRVPRALVGHPDCMPNDLPIFTKNKVLFKYASVVFSTMRHQALDANSGQLHQGWPVTGLSIVCSISCKFTSHIASPQSYMHRKQLQPITLIVEDTLLLPTISISSCERNSIRLNRVLSAAQVTPGSRLIIFFRVLRAKFVPS